MTGNSSPSRPLRVLHLAFEDHRRPGSGGGSLRNREINSRLAKKHDVTCVVARYPGARKRVEDGVTYKHIGLPLGYLGSIVAYHLCVPWYLLRHRADLVIEEFAAPHSSDLVPIWTSCPTVAMVQYLFADEKTREYHLPFWVFEDTGVRLHSRLIAVSKFVGDRLTDVNPAATVDVVYAGVEPAALNRPSDRANLLFLGRLEFGMKGLDLLVEAFQVILKDWPETRLRIAGSGPHRGRLETLLSERGLADSVDWLGRIDGDAKWAALSEASVLLMPSRYESFGLVAVEAMSAGTPVVAFAIPSLVEIVADTKSAMLVSPGDGQQLGRAACELLKSEKLRNAMSEAGRARAATFSWDLAALAHERIYKEVADQGPSSRINRLRLLARAVRALRQRQPHASTR